MEELSDDDVKEFASDWVKKIQNSILTAGDDVSTSDVVRARFGSSDERIYTNHEFREENGEIDFSNSRLESTFLSDFGNSATLRDLPVRVETTGVGEEHVVSFESTSKHSNVDRLSRTTVQQEKKITPRPDADFLRQKRLAFFESSLGPQERDDLRLFHDRNRNISKHVSAFQVPLHGVCDHKAYGSSIEQFDLYPLQSNAKQSETLGEMYEVESLETPLLNSFSGSNSHTVNRDSFNYQNINSPQGFETDEEEIKLELWGLKEAVHSGELDLNAYLKEPSWKDRRLFHASSHRFENNYKQQYGGKSPRETHKSLHDKIRPPHDINDETAKYTEFSHPEPQINGPLYSGFENSDSETSLLSFGSKCDDVHYRKVVKKQDASIVNGEISPRQSDLSINKTQGHKLKQKRGKDKILMELTEFIEGCGTPKDLKHSKKNSSIVNDLHLPDGNVPSVISAGRLSNTAGHMQDEFARRDDLINRTKDLSYNVSISESSIAQSHDRKQTNGTLSSEGHGSVKGKVCPKCDEVNSKAANWCIECGTALISVKVSCLTAQQQKVFEKQCEQTQALINQTLKAPMNFSHLLANDKAEREERSLSEDISNLSLQVSQSTSNLEEARYSSSPHGYKRRWMRSSIAWSTYHPSELTKSPSVVKNHVKTKERQRAISFSDLMSCSTKEKGSKHQKRSSRNRSARKRTVSCSSFGSEKEVMNTSGGFTNLKAFGHPQNTSLKGGQKEKQTSVVQKASPSNENQIESTASAKGRRNGMINTKSSSSHSLLKSLSVSSFDEAVRPSISQVSKAVVPPLNLQDVGSYDRILTLIRSQRDSEPVPYLYLPDEILLQIFSFLPHKDLVSCSRVCSQFYRISMDETLWKVIVLEKNNNITDEWLCAIGKRRPRSLTIFQCHSDNVTAKGLRDLFRNCSDSLEELNFSSCRGSELIGESVLLHVAARCCWLKSVDASWSNVSDNGVQAVVDNVKRLECLCLNGCQAVSDESIKGVANKHGKTLRIFEVFGCFNITPAGIRILGQTCKQLQTLNIGQCHKITNSAIGSLVSNLPELENLDLRGCKQVRDSAVKKIVRHCPLVTTLVLANCPLITDVSLVEIATNLPRIRSLDICNCSKVSDNGICALSKSCQRLELLDLTSTGVGHKSVLALANYCSQSLRNLKLSFCNISENTVVHLAKHCKRLTMLHLYSCKRIRNTSDLRLLNPALTIECDM